MEIFFHQQTENRCFLSGDGKKFPSRDRKSRSQNRPDFHGIAHDVKNRDFWRWIFRDTANRLRILMLILRESTTVNTLKKKIDAGTCLWPINRRSKNRKIDFSRFWARNSWNMENHLTPGKIAGVFRVSACDFMVSAGVFSSVSTWFYGVSNCFLVSAVDFMVSAGVFTGVSMWF